MATRTNPPYSSAEISRREFARCAGWAVAAAAVLPGSLLANPEPSAASRSGKPQERESHALSPESQARVEEQMQAILRRYGNRFDEEQKKELGRILAENERMLARVREFPLRNGDPPASVLKLCRGRKSPERESSAAPSSEGNR